MGGRLWRCLLPKLKRCIGTRHVEVNYFHTKGVGSRWMSIRCNKCLNSLRVDCAKCTTVYHMKLHKRGRYEMAKFCGFYSAQPWHSWSREDEAMMDAGSLGDVHVDGPYERNGMKSMMCMGLLLCIVIS